MWYNISYATDDERHFRRRHTGNTRLPYQKRKVLKIETERKTHIFCRFGIYGHFPVLGLL